MTNKVYVVLMFLKGSHNRLVFINDVKFLIECIDSTGSKEVRNSQQKSKFGVYSYQVFEVGPQVSPGIKNFLTQRKNIKTHRSEFGLRPILYHRSDRMIP